MRVPVSDEMRSEPFSDRAAALARKCVHCGFCNATCPTYQLTGDELEGPRGRIYLIKSYLEDGVISEHSRRHLDQCLLCRSCETTCPSGVSYGELIDLVRPEVQRRTAHALVPALKKWFLLRTVPHRKRFAMAAALGRVFKFVLPRGLKKTLSLNTTPAGATQTIAADSQRRVILLGGCAQPALNPGIDFSAAHVFSRLGIELVEVPSSGCCGALSNHLGETEAAAAFARNNIDVWWSHIEAGADAVVSTSSGCGVELKEYGRLLADDVDYAERAAQVAELCRDPLELLSPEDMKPYVQPPESLRIAVQAPCSLQHGHKLSGRLEQVLTELGFSVTVPPESHLCCGSAGSYSVLHPATADALRTRKLGHLEAGRPDVIVTANIGCQTHLAAEASVPVKHWLEFLAPYLR